MRYITDFFNLYIYNISSFKEKCFRSQQVGYSYLPSSVFFLGWIVDIICLSLYLGIAVISTIFQSITRKTENEPTKIGSNLQEIKLEQLTQLVERLCKGGPNLYYSTSSRAAIRKVQFYYEDIVKQHLGLQKKFTATTGNNDDAKAKAEAEAIQSVVEQLFDQWSSPQQTLTKEFIEKLPGDIVKKYIDRSTNPPRFKFTLFDLLQKEENKKQLINALLTPINIPQNKGKKLLCFIETNLFLTEDTIKRRATQEVLRLHSLHTTTATKKAGLIQEIIGGSSFNEPALRNAVLEKRSRTFFSDMTKSYENIYCFPQANISPNKSI